MAVYCSFPSFVMASRPNVYHACSVDLGWQTTVHSCCRCPRAALTPSAATAAIATQSNVEGTTSRFCPAGVHMGKCLPASEIFTGSWGPVSNINSALGSMLVSKFSKKYTDPYNTNSVVDGSSIDSGLPTWVPPNLPLPTTVHQSKASFSPSLPATPPIIPTLEPIPTPKPKPVVLEPVNVAVRNITPLSDVDTDDEKTIHVSETATPKQPEDAIVVRPKTPEVVVKPTEVKQFPDDHINVFSHKTDVIDTPEPVVVVEEVVDEEKVTIPEIETPSEINGSLLEQKLNTPLDKNSFSKVTVTSHTPTTPSTAISSKPLDSSKQQPSPQSHVSEAKKELTTTDKENRPEGVSKSTIADKKTSLKVEGKENKKVNGEIRHPSTTGSSTIPTFYLPVGRSKLSPEELEIELDRLKKAIQTAISSPTDETKKVGKIDSTSVIFAQFGAITKACGCPLYWKRGLFLACGGDNDDSLISVDTILKFWRRVLERCPDDASRFIYVLTGGKSHHLTQEDFRPIIQDVVDTHPSLTFLQAAPDFHSRYVTTVVARIFFCVNSSWSGRITLGELRKSNFLSILASLEEEEDINLVTQFFSYEHFYVIYCKFWELDGNHDLTISKSDLSRHNNYAISERMIDRIFSGAVTRGTSFKEGTMSYSEFVWFLLAEEDKRHPRSIEYWFRCMDLDGDGLLSLYELEYFYSEQSSRMEEMGIEPPTLEDCLCQCLDMVKPVLVDKIRLSDLKRCNLCSIFFDTFFNLHKYLTHEQRDPFANLRDIEEGLTEISDWDRYTSYAYEMLIASESGNQDNSATGGGDDDDDDEEEDEADEEDEENPEVEEKLKAKKNTEEVVEVVSDDAVKKASSEPAAID